MSPELTFEEALKTLQDTINQLEAGDLTLEESLTLYEKGQKLATQCQTQLENATLRVAQLNDAGQSVEQ